MTATTIDGNTTIKIPITHWIGVAAMMLAVAGAWVRIESAIESQSVTHKAFVESIGSHNASRAAVIEKQREIIDRLTIVAERLQIKQESMVNTLDDAVKRLREVERRIDKGESGKTGG